MGKGEKREGGRSSLIHSVSFVRHTVRRRREKGRKKEGEKKRGKFLLSLQRNSYSGRVGERKRGGGEKEGASPLQVTAFERKEEKREGRDAFSYSSKKGEKKGRREGKRKGIFFVSLLLTLLGPAKKGKE